MQNQLLQFQVAQVAANGIMLLAALPPTRGCRQCNRTEKSCVYTPLKLVNLAQ